MIKTILYILLKREDSFSVLLLKLFGGALLFLLFPISTYSQDFYAQQNEDNGITIIGDAKIITRENTSLKESYTENIAKEVIKQTSLKDKAKVFVKEKHLKNALAQTKKNNAEKYKNIEEKIKKNLQKIEYNNPFSSTDMANQANSNANAIGTVFSLSQNFAPAICIYQSLRKKLDVLYTQKNYYYNHHLSKLNFSEQFSVRPPPAII
ncbi:hypothetical protein H0S70_13015 [Chryseobacterium manosquense]|uniref:Uncharacterized protein n=1 Tax=Chryseobacterium manosquense TaxID=2754694 RepID=A0A7H1DW72_9FLAO|nr:hypothetical protein [Chryseobacterium manosquense]QNS41230.1 hypothetical protein H0S70_13015 [Chryseobacterium manosquense]